MNGDFDINLLPNDIRKHKINQQKFVRNFLYAFLLFLTFVTLNIVLWTIEYSYSVSQTNLNDSIKQTQAKIDGLQSIHKELQQLNFKFNVSQNVDKQAMEPEKILSSLSALTPQEITITNADIDLSKKPQITLQGNANARRDIVIFNEALNKSENFTGADTSSTTKLTSTQNPDSLSFTITVNIKEAKQ